MYKKPQCLVLWLGRFTRVVVVLVQLLENLQGFVSQLFGLGLQLGWVNLLAGSGLDGNLSQSSDLLLELVGVGLLNLLLELVQGVLGVVTQLVGSVGRLDGLSLGLVGLGELLGVLDHLLDLGVGQTRGAGNSDGGVLVGGLVTSRNLDDTIGVDVEGDLDLRNTLWCWWDTRQGEVTNQLVVSGQLSLTSEHSDLDGGSASGGSGEDSGLLSWDGGVSRDQSSENTAHGLNTQGQWGDVQKNNVLDLTGQDTTSDGSTHGDGLVGVDGLGWLLTEDGLDSLNDLWHSGHTTDQDDLGDVGGVQTSILQGLLTWLNGLLDQRLDQGLELRSGDLSVDVLRTRSVSGDERQVDLGGDGGRQLDLGLLSSLSDSLDGHSVSLQVDAGLLLEGLDNVSDNGNVKVLTTQVSVTVGGLDLEHTGTNVQHGDIEGTSTQVEDGNNLTVVLLQTVGQGGGGWLVHHSHDVQTDNLTGVLGGLSLGIVKVSWTGDHSVVNWLTHVGLGGLLHLVQDETTDLWWGVLLATGLDPGVTVLVLDDLVRDSVQVSLHLGLLESSTNQSLGGKQGVLGVDDGLTLGGDTDQTLTLLGEGDDGRSGSSTFGVLDDFWDFALHHGNGGVGGTQVDTDDGTAGGGGLVTHETLGGVLAGVSCSQHV